jgi:hypothetical protein
MEDWREYRTQLHIGQSWGLMEVSESPHTVGAAKLVNVKKKQRPYYSSKQKWHTLKAQVVVGYLNGLIVCTTFDKGRTSFV